MQFNASFTDRTEIRSGRVGRLQPLGKLGVLSLSKRQGLDPTEGTRLDSADFGLCHMCNNFEN
jgi:hypothetical protein